MLTITHLSISAASYYSKTTGNLNVLTTWGLNTDGSGTNPTNFTTAGNRFIIVNNATPTISTNWTVSWTGSKVLVGDGTQTISFTVPTSRTAAATYSVMVNSTLTWTSGATITGTINVNGSFDSQDMSTPTLGTLASGSSVIYSRGGNQTIADGVYYNLTLSGSGTKNLDNNAGTTVTNVLTVNTGVVFRLKTTNSILQH